MKTWFKKEHLTDPGFYVAVFIAVAVAGIVWGIAKKYIPGVQTVATNINSAVGSSL